MDKRNVLLGCSALIGVFFLGRTASASSCSLSPETAQAAIDLGLIPEAVLTVGGIITVVKVGGLATALGVAGTTLGPLIIVGAGLTAVATGGKALIDRFFGDSGIADTNKLKNQLDNFNTDFDDF